MHDLTPPFFLGVTGTMDFPGYDAAVSKSGKRSAAARGVVEHVHAVLDWLRRPPEVDAPGGAAPWPGLGLDAVPIVVLTALAPGIDTLVAEAVLDYANLGHPNVTVRCVLPFPWDVYQGSSSFAGKSDAARREHVRRLEMIVARIRDQPGFVSERDLAAVALGAPFRGDPVDDLKTGSAEARPRRRLYYRAAGERIAFASHLLLALFDERSTGVGPNGETEDLGDPFVTTTYATVTAMLRGATHELLAVLRGPAWVDNGPVLHIPIDRIGDGSTACARPLTFLYPSDMDRRRPGGQSFGENLRMLIAARQIDGRRPDATSQMVGHALFRRIAARHREFCAVPGSESEANAISEFVDVHALDGREATKFGPQASAYIMPLASIAAIRRRAADAAASCDQLRSKLLLCLAWAIFGAATLLGIYEHWRSVVPESSHGDVAWPHRVQAGLLGAALLLVLSSGWLFWRYRRTHAEERRFDYRAIAEGLRVQMHWAACGVQAEAGAEYMQRHRGELTWIRRLLTSVSFPAERFSALFAGLTHSAQCELFHATRLAWVHAQARNAATKAHEKESAAHRWHLRGWALGAAGLLNVIGKFLAAAISGVEHAIEAGGMVFAGWVAWSGAVLFLATSTRELLRDGRQAPREQEDSLWRRPFLVWVLARPRLWGAALLLGAVVFGLPPLLASLPLAPLGWPDAHSWWLILTGVPLLGGALCLAWSERNFFAEHARQYRALAAIYSATDRRLEEWIDRYRAQAGDEAAARHTLAEIHAILYHVGREALAENAEWLILHRTRPLEPFMAG